MKKKQSASYQIGNQRIKLDDLNKISANDANAMYYATHQGNKQANTVMSSAGSYVDTGMRGSFEDFAKNTDPKVLDFYRNQVHKAISSNTNPVPALKKPQEKQSVSYTSPKQKEEYTKNKYAIKDALRNNQAQIDENGQINLVPEEDTSLKPLGYYERRDLEEESRNIRARGQGMSNLDRKRVKDINELLEADNRLKKPTAQKTDNYLVHKDRYNKLMQDGRFANDIDMLVEVEWNNADQDATVSPEWAAEYGAKKITGGLNKENFYDQLSKRYDLTKQELRDIALTRKAEKQAEEDARNAEALSQYAQQNGGTAAAASALSLLGTIGSGGEGLYNTVVSGITGDDRYTSRMFNTVKNAPRQGVNELIDNPIGQTAYNIGMGVGDMFAGAAVGSAPAILAGNTANERLLESIDKGIDPRQAALYAGGAGAVDYITNTIGLDNATKLATQSIKSVGKKAFLSKNAIAGLGEAGENVIQDIAESFLDQIINGKNSNLQLAYEQYYEKNIAKGMSQEDAQENAFASVAADYGKDILMSAGTGYAMGAAMQGGKTFLNYLSGEAGEGIMDENKNRVQQRLAEYEAAKQADDVSQLQSNLQLLGLPQNDIESVEANIIAQIRRHQNGEMPSNELINMGTTHQYLSDFGNTDNDVFLKQSKLDKMMAEKNQKLHQHGLTPEQIAGYVRDANSPIAVYESPTQKGRPVIVGDRVDNDGAPIASALALDQTIGRNKGTLLTSEYGKDSLGEQLKYARKEGRMKFENREKVDSIISDRGLGLPKSDSDNDLLSNQTIAQNRENVNTQDAKQRQYENYNRLRATIDNKRLAKNVKFDNEADSQAFDTARKDLYAKTNAFTEALETGDEDAIIKDASDIDNAYRTLRDTASKGYVNDKTNQAELRRIKKDFANKTKGIVINLPDDMRSEMGIKDETINGLNRRLSTLGGNDHIKFSKSKGTPIDQIWTELVDASGKQLNANALNNADMVIQLIEYVDGLKVDGKGVERVPADISAYIPESFSDAINTMANDAIARGNVPQNIAENAGVSNPTITEPIPQSNNSAQPIDTNPNPNNGDVGVSKVITKAAINSGVLDPNEIYDPAIKDMAEYAVLHNDDTFNTAYKDVAENGDTIRNEYVNGSRTVTDPTELDRAMLILQDLYSQLEGADDATKSRILAERNAILSKVRKYGTKAGQDVQAFAKWNNTADGAMLTAEKMNADKVKTYVSRNKKKVEGNSRIARALAEMGNKTKTQREKPVLTHDQIKKGVIAELSKEFGSISDKFNDDDIEFLTKLAEDKSIPVWQIVDEIEHKLNHGEWYELTPEKSEKLKKSSRLSNLLDRAIGGKQVAKEAKAPETFDELVDRIRNTFADDEMSSISDQFNENDYAFIATMFQEKVPSWQIEDELRHKLETGEWYTLDESTEIKKPTNRKLENAFKALLGDETPAKGEEPTFEQIREEVRNTVEKEMAGMDERLDLTDDDITYLANLINNGADKSDLVDALNTKIATGNFGISAETQNYVNRIFNSIKDLDVNSQEFVEGQAEAFRALADEISPDASPLEKFDTWRYMAMLGNPKTMLRNWVGNKMFGAVMGFSNNLAALMEEAYDRGRRKLGGKGLENRTKTFLNPAKDKGLIDAARQDAYDKRFRQIEGSKYEKSAKDAIRANRSVFKSDLMKGTEALIDKGISDTKAVSNKYATSMAGYLKANGYDASVFDAQRRYDELLRNNKLGLISPAEKAELDELRPTIDMLEKARDYALKQAEYATFHEDNAVAEGISKHLRDWKNSDSAIARAFGYMGEGILPFKKTPANILRSGFELSPFGAIKSIAETGKLIMENTGKNKGNLENEYTHRNRITGKESTKTKTTGNDVIESWSKTLTGTGLAMLGYYLFNKGILTSSNEDEKRQDQLEGKQNYAININGHNYTLDWAAPGVMPLLLGAEWKKLNEKFAQSDEKWYQNPDEIVNTVNTLLDPMFETSMMSGVQDTFQTAANELQYNKEGAVGGILGTLVGNALTGYVTQAVPTLSGQIARTVDPIRRTTDTKNTKILGAAEKQGRKILNKLPFASKLNTAYIDAHGEQQNNSPFGNNIIPNLLYQTLSPGYYDKHEPTKADQLARDAYNAIGEDGEPIKDASVFADWKSSVKINGEKLSPEQMEQYRETGYSERNKIREALADSDWFSGLSGENRTEILKNTNTLADYIGKKAVDPEYTNESDAFNAYEEGGVEGVLNYYQEKAHKNEVKKALGTSSEWAAAIYDSGNQKEIDGVKAARDIAKEMGFDDLTENEYLHYKRGGKWELKKELGYKKKAADIGVNDGKFVRSLIDTGVSERTIKKAHDEITSVISGQDEFDRDEHLNMNKETYEVWDKYGKEGLNDYVKIKDSGANWNTYRQARRFYPSMTVDKYISTFNSLDGSADSKANGEISQKELLKYYNSHSVSEAEVKKMWSAYGDADWKGVPVLKKNKKTNKNEWQAVTPKKK